MTSRRSFIAGLAVAPVAIVAPAVAALPAAQHPDWLALLANEQQAEAAFSLLTVEQEQADSRFFDACRAAEQAWQRAYDAHSRLPHVPLVEGESPAALEARVQQAIGKWNAENRAMRDDRDGLEARLRVETGLAEVEQRCETALSTYVAAVKAIIAYPSRDPDIIAHKLRLMLDQYGDDSDGCMSLLASITGEGLSC
ncbi:hypothetical protein LL251_02140 [Sphingobium naphthae]|nr:hypothetical protein [Sphingobium naphthae]